MRLLLRLLLLTGQISRIRPDAESVLASVPQQRDRLRPEKASLSMPLRRLPKAVHHCAHIAAACNCCQARLACCRALPYCPDNGFEFLQAGSIWQSCLQCPLVQPRSSMPLQPKSFPLWLRCLVRLDAQPLCVHRDNTTDSPHPHASKGLSEKVCLWGNITKSGRCTTIALSPNMAMGFKEGGEAWP